MNIPAPPEWQDDELERAGAESELDDDPGLDLAVLRRRRELALTFVTLSLIIAVSAFTAFRLLKGPPDTADVVRGVAEQAIRNYLGAGLRIQFSDPNETYISNVREGVREVVGNVVAVTAAGKATYYRYRCNVAENEGHWEPERLELTPD